jgi:hypothetical protein
MSRIDCLLHCLQLIVFIDNLRRKMQLKQFVTKFLLNFVLCPLTPQSCAGSLPSPSIAAGTEHRNARSDQQMFQHSWQG